MTLNNQIIDLLKNGGYTLYIRHGEATIGEDKPYINFFDCSSQRNLSEEGRKQAIQYRHMLFKLKLPLHYPVLTSPFCRTKETAEIIFGRGNVQILPALYEIYKLNGPLLKEEQAYLLSMLTTLLETKPPQGFNRVIVAHAFPEGLGLGSIPNMGTVIVQPLGKGAGYVLVDKLSLEDL
jgi:hypothetical protein